MILFHSFIFVRLWWQNNGSPNLRILVIFSIFSWFFFPLFGFHSVLVFAISLDDSFDSKWCRSIQWMVRTYDAVVDMMPLNQWIQNIPYDFVHGVWLKLQAEDENWSFGIYLTGAMYAWKECQHTQYQQENMLARSKTTTTESENRWLLSA